MIGIGLIAFIGWWFFAPRPEDRKQSAVVANHQTVAIDVNGGYAPETVELQAGVPATLNFTRRDPSGCLDHVVFNDFGINQELPKGKTESIDIDTSKPGVYQWACGMDMFHGKVIIKA
ncbi:cupredoxin domain-containing protein (plasmid) [Nicoliella spurrieriana]|uniref:Cupredoxin domain-containing protein n=1 Tax=Nicoliella spurrieriana TaxID=2925830 RepID=A0A976RQF2_9LACO|nr:cupredoxin domain-containing protein [Nicoliella spurrieriana]UQS85916.1 cupredoxin domain-containing protein [Nicoliella spurrieriana]